MSLPVNQTRCSIRFVVVGALLLGSGACKPTERPGASDVRQLEAVPYLAWSESPHAKSERSGVTVHDEERASAGYNLVVSRVKPRVDLVDMAGKVVHTWRGPPEVRHALEGASLLPNGDLLILDKYREVLRLDRDSGVVWKHRLPGHHDVRMTEDGHLLVVVEDRKTTHNGLQKVIFDGLVEMDQEGEILWRWSSFDALEEMKRVMDTSAFLDTRVDGSVITAGAEYDYFHMNSVSVIGPNPHEADPRFRRGNLLVCFRNVNQIAILDGQSRKVLWAWGAGELDMPHHPTMLPSGNILIYDNGKLRKHSRVIELDPVTGAIGWEYETDPPSAFFSAEKGSAQRLANGNTLICDGDNGRAFEVTRTGDIVWEYLVRDRNDKGQRGTMYRISRYSSEYVAPILTPRTPPQVAGDAAERRVKLADLAVPKRDGAQWNCDTCVRFETRLVVETPEPVKASVVELSRDNDDRYIVTVESDRGTVVSTLEPRDRQWGLVADAVILPAAASVRRVVVEAAGGDGRYSMGHVQLR